MAEVQTPIEVKLGDGSVVKADNIEEAFQKVAKMKEDTAAELKRTRDELQGFKSQFEDFQRKEQEREVAARRQEAVKDGKFDSERYYQLLNTDPVAANDYYFEYRFGRKPEDFNNEYQRVQQQVSVFEQERVAASFQARHAEEFPATPEAAKAMRQKTEELISQGHPFSTKTLEMAWGELVESGTIKPLEQKEEKEERANPVLAGGGAQEFTPADAEKLSDKELEAQLRKMGAFR